MRTCIAIVTSILVSLVAVTPLPAADGSDKWEIQLPVDHWKIVIGEPVEFVYDVINRGTSQQFLEMYPQMHEILIAKGEEPYQVWVSSPPGLSFELIARGINPGHSYQLSVRIVAHYTPGEGDRADGKYSLVWSEAGIYRIKIRYIISGKLLAESPEATVEVVKPEGKDALAFEIYAYEPLLRLARYQVWPDQRERIDPEARRRIELLLTEYADTPYGKAVEQFREKLFPEPAKDTRPERHVEEAIRELEAMRYDIKAIEASHPDATEEHLMQLMELVAQADEGKLTEEELYIRLAELTREFVLKHGTPLSEEEWAKLQERRQREKAEAQQKQQDEAEAAKE